jgi:hypothetical protein
VTPRGRWLRSCILAAAVVSAACSGTLTSAKSDFKGGRMAEAKEKLVSLEPEARGWTGPRRAEYTLYRGLVESSLGDREAALGWLKEARSIHRAEPKTLSEDDRTRLDLALDALGAHD